jgi:hypothetical protein
VGVESVVQGRNFKILLDFANSIGRSAEYESHLGVCFWSCMLRLDFAFDFRRHDNYVCDA